MFPRHLLLALLLIASPVLAADDVMRYPRAPAGDEFRPLYPLALLQLALDKAASDLRLEPSDYHMEQQRALLSLERGEAVDVVWTMTSIEREQRLLPVETSSSYDSLFLMLRAERFDYFPRAVLEANAELQHMHIDDLTLDRHLVLHYPTALYFFFSPQKPQLADAVRQGLELALADGSFDRLFQQHHADDLRRARLDQRRIIELDNPLLPPHTPLQRRELWYHP